MSGTRVEGGGGAQTISAGVQKTIKSIKEIVGNHSDEDIYFILKEANMDPNESVQKLLHQDTFHEVKRRRGKKKENTAKTESVRPGRKLENSDERNGYLTNSGGNRGRKSEERTRYQMIPGNNGGRKLEETDERKMYQMIPGNNDGRKLEETDERTGYQTSPGNNGGRKLEETNERTRYQTIPGNNGGRKSEETDERTRYQMIPGNNGGNKLEETDERTRYQTIPGNNRGRGGYVRNAYTGRRKEFRIVKDNRVNQSKIKDTKPALQQSSTSPKQPITSKQSEISSTGTSNSQKSLSVQNISQDMNGPTDSQFRTASDANSSGNTVKDLSDRRMTVSNKALPGTTGKPIASQTHSTRPSSSNSVVGVYSSASDPVHVPSLDSTSSIAVGPIRREVGVVGVRKQSSESLKNSSITGSSISNSIPRENNSSAETTQHSSSTSKSDQLNPNTSHESPTQNMSAVSRPFLTSQHGSRSNHQPMGHKKVFKPIKEWKPKSTIKSNSITPGAIESPANSDLPSADNHPDYSNKSKTEEVKSQDKLSVADVFEKQNVVIAEHIRVAETDRFLLTFGSVEPGLQLTGSAGMSSSGLSSTPFDISASREVDKQDDTIPITVSDSPASGAAAELHEQSSSPQNSDNYADIGIVHDNKQFYGSLESQHVQESADLPSFRTYDPPTGYDIPYFRPSMDESPHRHVLPSPQEDLSSYMTSVPSSTVAMMPQHLQQQPLGQIYPQVHLSQFPNVPYRQFISPVYVPPMAMPGYSNNTAYPHPSNGSSYMVIPGGSSHPNASSLKYGVQQFKPLATGTLTGFGNFTSPSGYAINAPGVVGGAIGLEDSSRLKYKDGNLYVPNPQAETSEYWVHNQRELQGMQSAPYYNMTGQQQTPQGAYLPPHTGHASFNSPGMYHPQQPPPVLSNTHHLAPAMGGSLAGIGIPAAAPRPQVGPYQQPQLSHLNWIPNL